MKKAKILIFVSLIFVLTLVAVPGAWAAEGNGTVPTLPVEPGGGPFPESKGFDAVPQNEAEPWATSDDPLVCNPTFNLWDDLTAAPDPLAGKWLFGYGWLSCAPATVCFPVESGYATKIYYYSPSYGWVTPGLPTSTMTVGTVKYRCADAPAPGYYGLMGAGAP